MTACPVRPPDPSGRSIPRATVSRTTARRLDSLSRALMLAGGLALALSEAAVLAQPATPPQPDRLVAPALRRDELAIVFAESLDFSLEANLPSDVTEVVLRYTVGQDNPRNRRIPEYTPGQAIRASHSESLVRGQIPPASMIRWWWTLQLADGRTMETVPQERMHLDERFQWQSLDDPELRVWWYDQEPQFAREIQDKAEAALDRLEPLIGSRPERRIELVAYQSQEDLRPAMFDRGGSYETRLVTLGARVAPDILILDAGSGADELNEVIAHELSHIVINLHFEEDYVDAPLWLDEGLAMYVEGPLESGEARSLERAIRDDELMSVRSLSSFPGDADQVELAYAQSRDFVEHLIQSGGEDRFRELLARLGTGELSIDEALQEAYGFDQLGLYQSWRAAKDLPPAATPAPGQPTRSRVRGAGAAPGGDGPLPCLPALLTPMLLGLAIGHRRRRTKELGTQMITMATKAGARR